MYVWKQLSPSVPFDVVHGTACGLTDKGPVRNSNEDNFLIEPGLGLMAVADGMGGHESGEIASADALNWLSHYLRAKVERHTGITNFKPSSFDPVQADPAATWTDATIGHMVILHEAIEFTNQRMYQTNVDNYRADGEGMGTTLSAVWRPAPDSPLLVCHVGDTRLYRWRDGCLTQRTRDHTMYQQALDAGMHDRLPSRNLLMQAVGPAYHIEPDLQLEAVEAGDLFLLCSDGLHGTSSDADIASVLASGANLSLDLRCAQLIELAKRDGSRDNITVLLYATA